MFSEVVEELFLGIGVFVERLDDCFGFGMVVGFKHSRERDFDED